MKVAILAGGQGSRLAEETRYRPKPLVEIGGRPILWHLLRLYRQQGFDEFVIALGHQGQAIRDYFADHAGRNGPDLPGDLGRVHLVDTGEETATGGRIARLRPHLDEQTFMLTWADGLADIDLHRLLDFHRTHGKLATVTAVHPPARFGQLTFGDDHAVTEFREKPPQSEGWINGAFFVLEPGIFDYIVGDATRWEQAPLEDLARDRQLMAYRHEGFWQCMDTLHDRTQLERLWQSNAAPWKLWSE